MSALKNPGLCDVPLSAPMGTVHLKAVAIFLIIGVLPPVNNEDKNIHLLDRRIVS